MTDQTVVRVDNPALTGAGRVVTVETPSHWHLDARSIAAALLPVLVAVLWYFLSNEGPWVNIGYVASVSMMLVAAGMALTRRVLAPVIATALIIAIIVITSAEKLRLMHMAIHAYDVVYYLSSPATLKFLFVNFPLPMIQLFGAFAVLGTAAWYCHRIDPIRIHRGAAFVGASVFACLGLWSANLKGSRPDMQQFGNEMALSTFYSSWSETVSTLWRGQLFEAGPKASGAAFVIPATCEVPKKPPNIILIHQESIVPPEFFPGLGYDKSVDPMFRSSDGKLHPLRVETYAGASWLTEFSLLTGVSTYSFGSMRPFVQAMMAGKVHDTLPQALERCGYRNTVFYPLSKDFVSNGRFYEAVGMPDIYDMKRQGSTSGHQRDKFFYDNMLTMMDEHFATSQKPLFSFLITFASHQPYHFTFMPELNVPGGAPGTGSEMNEYLRRLSMAHIDYEAMKADLKKRFPNERFLIVHYGDHQPTSTWSMLAEQDKSIIRNKDRAGAKTSPAYLTYYAVEGINYTVPNLPDVEALGVPYLGTVLLDAAGLPLSPAYTERKHLMQICGGRYDGCDKQDQILAFHRRLIDSGIMEAR